MTQKIFFSVTMSLDGYIAPETSPENIEAMHAMREGGSSPALDRWMSKWGRLQGWMFEQRFIRENLGLGEGGEEGRDNEILEATFERTGASIMGKRMFELGEAGWPEDPPFHTPVFVLTHEKRDPWPRPGGTTFHFINDGIESALEQAREAAGDRDVRIAGGAETIGEYLEARLLDEFHIALAPVFFSSGVRLFDHIDVEKLSLKQTQVEPSSPITHLGYAIEA